MLGTTLCSNCRKNSAVFLQRHSGRRLCKACFVDDIKARIKSQINRYLMITANDVVAVGVSGGKDSYVLLNILIEIIPPTKIIGIMIDEGIARYTRSEIFNSIKIFCSAIGIDCIYISMREVLGYGVDDFMNHYIKLSHNKSSSTMSACTYCGIARRRILNLYARELGATKVATGHNLDDEVQTYIINILRGDIMRLIQLHPLSETHSNRLIKRVKPLRSIYEYETAYYAYLLGYTFQEYECPYIEMRPTLRVKIRELLNEVERSTPGIQLRLLEVLDNAIINIVKSKHVTLPLCKLCGEPTSPGRTICKFCELIDYIRRA